MQHKGHVVSAREPARLASHQGNVVRGLSTACLAALLVSHGDDRSPAVPVTLRERGFGRKTPDGMKPTASALKQLTNTQDTSKPLLPQKATRDRRRNFPFLLGDLHERKQEKNSQAKNFKTHVY